MFESRAREPEPRLLTGPRLITSRLSGWAVTALLCGRAFFSKHTFNYF